MLICGAVGFLVAWSLIPLIQKLANRKPASANDRSFHHTHVVPVPRFGGIAIAAGFVVVVAVAAALSGFQAPIRLSQWGMIVGSLAMFALGLKDDFQPLGAKVKLLVQLLVAAAVYFSGVQIEQVKNPITGAVYSLGA